MSSNIRQYLQKVLQSSEFQNASKYQKLLEYLVNSTLEGNVPKEITIAMELFGSEMNDDTLGESNIRVYVHNIRKKLDSYYINEGRNDKIQFRIPKGRYKVEFVNRKDIGRPASRRAILITGIILSVLLAANLFRLVLSRGEGPGKGRHSQWIWGDLLSRDAPLLVIVGDYYLIQETGMAGRSRYLRDVRINSESDLDLFLEEFPEQGTNFERTKHTYLGKYAPLCIEKLSKLLLSSGKDFQVILSSEFHWKDLRDYNVIYIGSFKSMGVLNNLTKHSNFRFELYPSALHFHDLEEDSVYHYRPFDSRLDDAFETDYSIATKLPGSNGRSVFMFVSVRDIGMIETVEYFTNPESQKMFMQSLDPSFRETGFFEACFKIEGLDRNSISIDLLHLNPLSASSLFEMEGGSDPGGVE